MKSRFYRPPSVEVTLAPHCVLRVGDRVTIDGYHYIVAVAPHTIYDGQPYTVRLAPAPAFRSHGEATVESFAADPVYAGEYLRSVAVDGDEEEARRAMLLVAEALERIGAPSPGPPLREWTYVGCGCSGSGWCDPPPRCRPHGNPVGAVEVRADGRVVP